MTTDTEDLLWRRFNEWFRARRPDYPSEWDAYQAVLRYLVDLSRLRMTYSALG